MKSRNTTKKILSDLLSEIGRLESLEPLLTVLYHHHIGQAKGGERVSNGYSLELASRIATTLGDDQLIENVKVVSKKIDLGHWRRS